MKNTWKKWNRFLGMFLLGLSALLGFTQAANAAIPAAWANIKHVIIIMFENQDASAPLANAYFKSLSLKGAYLSQDFAISHPSEPNYYALTAGTTFGVTDDGIYNLPAKFIGDLFEARGLTWKAYLEDWPGGCFTTYSNNNYRRQHNPFISYTSVSKNTARCTSHLVVANQIFSDISANTLPTYSFYVPNILNDGHNTGVSYAATWLQNTFGALLSNPNFLKDTLVILTYDEGTGTINHVYTTFLGAGVQGGFNSSIHYTHYSLLRTIEDIFALGNLGQNDATATPITDIWQSGTVNTGTLALSAGTASDVNCANAVDTLRLDGSATGMAFTVKNGVSQTLSTGMHAIALASSQAAIPAGGGLSGTCAATLSTPSINITTGTVSTVTATWKFTATPPTTATLNVQAASGSSVQCAAAIDTLFVDGSASGTKFTVRNGLSQSLSAGTHTLKLASGGSAIPVTGGSCTGSLSSSSVSLVQGQVTTVLASWKFAATPPPAQGTLTVQASNTSDVRCNSATDTLFFAGNSAGTPFLVSKGLTISLNVGTNALTLASGPKPIPAGGGQNGSCRGVLSSSNVTITQGVTTPVTVTYTYTPDSATGCTVTTSKVTAKDTDWDAFQITVSLSQPVTALQGQLTVLTQIGGIWVHDFPMQTSLKGTTASFSGPFTGNAFMIKGVMANTTPVPIGANPLVSMTINGMACTLP